LFKFDPDRITSKGRNILTIFENRNLRRIFWPGDEEIEQQKDGENLIKWTFTICTLP
jgi:hypothetical protein